MTGLDRLWGFQKVEAARIFRQSALLAVRIGRLYTAGNIPGAYWCQRLSLPQGISAAGGIKSMKNSMTTSGIVPATLRLVAQCLNQLRNANMQLAK